SLLLRGGLVLTGLYVAWIVAVLVAAWPVARSAGTPVDRATALSLVAVLLALVPMHVLFPYALASGPQHALWLLAGLVAAARAGGRTGSEARAEA
ncbi:MAG TPA: hypothetical protein VK894_14575, partial [Jiangellales bacterium]|nr:hypothetical protein [Jiangellales bacterium]